MRRRRPDTDSSSPEATTTVNESIQTDDEDTNHIVRKAMAKKAKTRQEEFTERWMGVQVSWLVTFQRVRLLIF